MNVVIDLIEAYSEYIGMPIMLVKINGQIEYTANHHGMGNHLLFVEKQRYVNKIKKVAETLKVPTVMSVSDDCNHSDTFYIVTPIFELNEETYFVAAGHFCIRNTFGMLKTINQERINNFYDEYEIDDISTKINNFYQLLLSKVEVKRRVQEPANLEEVLNSISNLNFHESNEKINIKLILEEYVKINEIDFIGYAVKDNNDAFSISSIVGENVYHLINKKFYIGEGVLGKAAIIGEDFYWHIEENAKRNEFLHRYGIFPTQLFGFALQDSGDINKVIFCGSFSNKTIDTRINQFLKCLVQLTLQYNPKNSRLMDVSRVQTLFSNWIDFVDIATSVTDKKQIIYKILELCQTLNSDNFACVTTAEHELFYRGRFTTSGSESHQYAYTQLKQNPHLKLWINEQYIHYAVEIKTKGLNLFTVNFTKEVNMHYMTTIFEMIGKSIANEFNLKSHTNPINMDSIFDILYQTMEDMNEEKYSLATRACNLISKLHHILPIDSYICTKIKNICKVMPYSMELLQKHIHQTDEWLILKQYKFLKETNRLTTTVEIQYQFIAFVDDIILQHRNIKHINYMDKELKDICYSFYMKYENDEVEVDLNIVKDKETEERSHLRDVINTLDLTLREKEVLSLIIEGMNNHEVGELLKISPHTVKNHVTNIFKKLDVSDRMQATAKVYRIRFGA